MEANPGSAQAGRRPEPNESPSRQPQAGTSRAIGGPQTRAQEVTQASGETAERPWYEGLTAQERADAKRRYKNRKGVERWRRRKQAQRAKDKEILAEGQQLATTGSQSRPPEGLPEGRNAPRTELLKASASGDTEGKDAGKQGSGSNSPEGRGYGGKSSSSQTPSSDEVVIPERRQADQMLHEFQKLGKANEAKMKAVLDTLASYAMIPHGFQRHKGRIVRLAEEVLNIARNGPPTMQDIANRFLRWNVKFTTAWEDPEIPNFHQIMNVFARGEDSSTYVKVALQDGASKTVTLRQLSQFDEAVHKELFIGLIHQILREMPLALQKTPIAQQAKGSISKHMKQASMVASGYIIGQFVSFTTQRAIRKNVAVPMQGMMYAAASLGLRNDTCQRLWQVWDMTTANLQPLLEKYQVLEHRLDSLLVLHDIHTDGSYHAIFNAVEQLMQNFEEQFDVSYYADLKCSHEILNPLQLGLLAAAQVPKLPLRQILAENIDPYPRISIVFESGAVPRFR